jgi:nitroreductase
MVMTTDTPSTFSWDTHEASASAEIHPLLRKRFSGRAFAPVSLEQSQVNLMLEAASWSSSSMNEQPWRYAVALRSDETRFGQFLSCLQPGNRVWAQHSGALLLSLAYNWHDGIQHINRFDWHDVGAANTSLLLQATHMGLIGRMMGGFDFELTASTFGVSTSRSIDGPQLVPVCFIALGYPTDSSHLEEPFRSRELTPRKRKSVEDFMFSPF